MKFVAVWLLLRFVVLDEPVPLAKHEQLLANSWTALGASPVFKTQKDCEKSARMAPFIGDRGRGKSVVFFCVRGFSVDRPK